MKLTGDKVYVRSFEESDAESVLAMLLRNRDFFEKYAPQQSGEYYTLESQREAINRGMEGTNTGVHYPCGIFDKETDEVIGAIMLAKVVRGPLQSCMLGYYLDQQHNGRGLTTEAAELMVNYAFEEVGLHRVYAEVMPRNIGSLRVLEKIGFRREGVSRQNLLVDGVWEDHVVLAMLADEWRTR